MLFALLPLGSPDSHRGLLQVRPSSRARCTLGPSSRPNLRASLPLSSSSFARSPLFSISGVSAREKRRLRSPTDRKSVCSKIQRWNILHLRGFLRFATKGDIFNRDQPFQYSLKVIQNLMRKRIV